MSRIHPKNPYDPQVDSSLKELKTKLGFTPNIFQLMGHSKAMFMGFTSFSKYLEQSHLSPKIREAIALCVAGFNSCAYCTAAHTKIAAGCGISAKEIALNLGGKSEDKKIAHLLQFCIKILEKRGHIPSSEIEMLLHQGVREEELIEIVGVIALNITTNMFNNVFTPVVDF